MHREYRTFVCLLLLFYLVFFFLLFVLLSKELAMKFICLIIFNIFLMDGLESKVTYSFKRLKFLSPITDQIFLIEQLRQ